MIHWNLCRSGDQDGCGRQPPDQNCSFSHQMLPQCHSQVRLAARITVTSFWISVTLTIAKYWPSLSPSPTMMVHPCLHHTDIDPPGTLTMWYGVALTLPTLAFLSATGRNKIIWNVFHGQKRCYEERFVVVEMFDRNIQACWPQDALPPSWCCRQGAKRPGGICHSETLAHLKFWWSLFFLIILCYYSSSSSCPL